MNILTEQSKELIQKVFETTDVYFLNNFKPEYLNPEGNRDYLKYFFQKRWEFLYKSYGLVSTLNDYSTELSRLFEFTTFQDYPYALRHKVNIIQSLLECSMDTYVPVHVSIRPINKQNFTLDFNDLVVNPQNYEMVCHPGFTRGVGSTFLNTPLKKVFFYVKKEHRVNINTNKNIVKLNNVEEILKYYTSPHIKDTSKKYFFNFFMHKGDGVENGFKYHTPTDTPILKLNSIKDEDNIEYHPSILYRQDTFRSFNEFCKIIFSNKIRIITETGNKFELENKFKENRKKLANSIFNSDINFQERFVVNKNDYPKAFIRGLIPPDKNFLLDEETYTVYQQFHKILANYSKEDNSILLDNTFMLGSYDPIEEKESINDLNLFVTENNFSGIIIIVNKEFTHKLSRLFYELLYCFSYNATLVTTRCGGLKIINCNHKYWTKEETYKELYLEDSFFNYE